MRCRLPLVMIGLSCLLLLAGASTAAAQFAPGASIGIAGGASVEGDLTPGLPVTTRLEPGWLVGLSTEYNFDLSRFGVRLAGTYARRALDASTDSYHVTAIELGTLYRLTSFAALIFSGGTTVYSGADTSPVFAGGLFGAEPVTRLHLGAAMAAEGRLSERLGVRLELGDRIVFPSIGESPPAEGFPIAHTPFAMLGLQYRVGGDGRPGSAVDRPVPVVAVPAEVQPPAAGDPARVDPSLGRYAVQPDSLFRRDAAESWVKQLLERRIPAWLIPSDVPGERGVRLRIGATETRSAALALASILERDYGWTLTVEPITAGEPVPADAVTRTSEFLSRPDRR